MDPIVENFKILKGSHYSKPWMFKFVSEDSFYISWKFYGKPKQTKRYTNKMFGVGYFPHHMWKSWRIGYEVLGGKIIYSLFIHVKGKFQIHPLELSNEFNGSLKVELSNDEIKVYDESGKGSKFLISVPFTTPKIKIGYILKPYHGGPEKSPSRYTISLLAAEYKKKEK